MSKCDFCKETNRTVRGVSILVSLANNEYVDYDICKKCLPTKNKKGDSNY